MDWGWLSNANKGKDTGRAASGFCLAFQITLHDDTLAVKNDKGELLHPIAQDKHTALFGQREVQLDVSMAINKVVDIGMISQIGFAVFDERFLVFAMKDGSTFALVLSTAVCGPLQS